MERVIEHTSDGSATLFVPELNEHYHSVKGARTESQHIFVEMGLNHSQAQPVRLLEIGFGTGLNAYLTLVDAQKTQRQIYYTGIELYPLEWSFIEQLHYTDDPVFREIHLAPWEEETSIRPNFILYKKQQDFTQLASCYFATGFDVIYFDAFAPEKQPEMWTQELFDCLYRLANPGGILTTYCAKGVIRRMLQQAGFVMERLPGPPDGKREILRGVKS